MAVKAVSPPHGSIGVCFAIKKAQPLEFLGVEALNSAQMAVKFAVPAHDGQHKLLCSEAQFFGGNGFNPKGLPKKIAVGWAGIERGQNRLNGIVHFARILNRNHC